MAEPSTTDRLALLYRLTQTFNSSLDLDEVLNRVMDEVIAAVRAERGFLMLNDAAGQLCFQVARGLDKQDIDQPKFQVSRGVIERVARTGEAVLTSDAQTDERLNLRQSVTALGLRSILSVPLQLKAQTLGVVYVDNRLQAGVFRQPDLELLTAIAANAAVAIENARLYQVAVEKGRLEREMQVARQVQASLLPRETPQLPGWQIAAHWQPAREVAGDYYDFIALPHPPAPSPEGGRGDTASPLSQRERESLRLRGEGERLGLVVADVTDKGMPAALFMALARSTVRAAIASAKSPADALAGANRLITADSPNSMFVTLAYVQVSANFGEIVCVNAGHNPVLIYRAAPGEFVSIRRMGVPLGLFAEASFDQRVEQLEPGDLIVLYTDGVTDALDGEGREFGMQRLEQLVRDQVHKSAVDLVDALRLALVDFSGPQPPHDDITVVVAKRV
ncbi:MAG: PP2C family protein-serine/threonine phosphatase [Anaerolineales bacterium]